jgi:hypothetical protein
MSQVWSEVVDEFLANEFVRDWLGRQRKAFSLDLGKKLRLLLELSRNKVMAHGSDERLTQPAAAAAAAAAVRDRHASRRQQET